MAGRTKRRRARRKKNPWIKRYSYKRKGYKVKPRTVKVTRHWRKPTRKRRKARRNAWTGDVAGHSRAAKKGWRGRRRARSNPPRPRARRNQWYGQPRRHAKAARKGWRRRARRNPYHYNRRRYRLRKNPLEAILGQFEEAFSGEMLEQVFHTALGFGGAVAVGGMLAKVIPVDFLKTPEGGIVATGVSAILLSVVGGMVMDKTAQTRIMAGGLVATALKILGVVLPEEAKEFVPTLGNDTQFQQDIQRAVLEELQAGGTQATLAPAGSEAYLTPAGSEYYVEAAGTSAYMTPLEAEDATMGAFLTEREAIGAEMGMGLDPVEADEIGRSGQREKF